MQGTEKQEKCTRQSGMIRSLKSVWERVLLTIGAWCGVSSVTDDSGKTMLSLKSAGTPTMLLIGLVLSFGQVFGGLHPFGVGLLLAAEEGLPLLFGGAFIGSLAGCGGFLGTPFLLLLIFFVRILICRTLTDGKDAGKSGARLVTEFREPMIFRMALGVSYGFLAGTFRLIGFGFERKELLYALLGMVMIPGLVFLFGGLFDRSSGYTYRYRLASAALAPIAVFSLSGLSFFGIRPSLLLAVVLTLASARLGGPLRGGVAGMLSGLGCGASFMPLFGIAGMTAGAINEQGETLPILSFLGFGAAWSICTEGLLSFASTLPNLLWGAAVYLPIARMGRLSKFSFIGRENRPSDEVVFRHLLTDRKNDAAVRQVEELSDAMETLSRVFTSLSNKVGIPDKDQLQLLCENGMRRHCRSCADAEKCSVGQKGDIGQGKLSAIASLLAEKGQLPKNGYADFPIASCSHREEICADINRAAARLFENAAASDKVSVTARNYRAVSDMLKENADAVVKSYAIDEDMTKTAKTAAAEIGLHCRNLAVYGDRRKTLVLGGVDDLAASLPAGEIGQAFSAACHVPFSTPVMTLEGDYATMTATSQRKIGCVSTRISRKKESEEVNGDSALAFSTDRDYFYALIADGMGSGRDAAITSRLTGVFLQKMLTVGNTKATVLSMLNGLIAEKKPECFSSVDLLEVDLLTGGACFVKSGAAASYILRNGKLFKIMSRSLPMGVTREITAEEIRFSLQEGDLIVMISDGVSQSFDDGIWFVDLLSSGINPHGNLSDIGKTILDTAMVKNERDDDMTVSLVRITAA